MRGQGVMLGVALLWPGLLCASVGSSDTISRSTTTEESAEVTEENPKAKLPVSAVLVYDNGLGLGAFVANEGARNVDWNMSVSLRPSLTLFDKLKLTLRVDVAKPMTTTYQGSVNADASASSLKRQLTVSDIMFITSVPEIYKEPVTGIYIGAGLTTYAPVSMLSRATTQVIAFRPHVNVGWAWEGLSLSYALYFKKNFHRFTNPTFNTAVLPDSLQFRPGGVEDLGNGEIADGTLRNTSHLIYNYAEVSYTLFDQLTASLSLFVINSFKYPLPLSDEFSSEYAKAAAQRDYTWGTLELGYQPWEHLSFSVGVSSYQPAFTADNKRLRFPFYDFVSPADNLTSFYFDVVGYL